MDETIEQLVRQASRLAEESRRLLEFAQKLCNHRRSDGTWAINKGYGITRHEWCCSYCGLDDCYFPQGPGGYKYEP